MNTVVKEPRQCLVCESLLRGRSDKKFCNDYCRNQYNNERKTKLLCFPALRVINNALLRNRKILRSLLPEGKQQVRTNGETLLTLGFQFRYITHFSRNRNGKTCYYCYDTGYLPIGNDRFLLVRKEPVNIPID